MGVNVPHAKLLAQVADRLAKVPSTIDHLMLTRWRVLIAAQQLLGAPPPEVEKACVHALGLFVDRGPGTDIDVALDLVGEAVRRANLATSSVLPSMTAAKKAEVSARLNRLAADPHQAIQDALSALPRVRQRLSSVEQDAPLPGVRHRLELVAGIVADPARSTDIRAKAAGAILYVDDVDDVIPDTLGPMGLLDDDYAVRLALHDAGEGNNGTELHWSEKIASLWDQLPFLRGINLQRSGEPVVVSWLDRVNSHASYEQVLNSEHSPLLLVQPSVACSPLHALVTLVGLLLLDAVTSSSSKAHFLRGGQTYEVDGCIVRFEEGGKSPQPGWLRLQLRDYVLYQPPGLADRLIPVPPRRLSTWREFATRQQAEGTDVLQKFFQWETAIAPASISKKVVLITSRERADQLLGDVESNGVRLVDNGLVQFVKDSSASHDVHGALLVVLPTLAAARGLMDRDVGVQSIVVDGFERLHHGRHDLPFLGHAPNSPPLIAWSTSGYLPNSEIRWLPPHRRLEVSPEDLASILELDYGASDPLHASLLEAATGAGARTWPSVASGAELRVIDAIESYRENVRASTDLPLYWSYHLLALAKTLRILVSATPAEWSGIRKVAAEWSATLDEKWSILRQSAASRLARIRDAERAVHTALADVTEIANSSALALDEFARTPGNNLKKWLYVCERADQIGPVRSAVRHFGLPNVEPALLRDLATCEFCVVAGWIATSFAQRLLAHTPRELIALVNSEGQQRWQRAAYMLTQTPGDGILSSVGVGRVDRGSAWRVAPADDSNDDEQDADRRQSEIESPRVACVFLWVSDESSAKVLRRGSHVIVENESRVDERLASQLRPGDRVLLGSGLSRWSPAEEFTEAVVNSVRLSQPELVALSKEWRRALSEYVAARRLSIPELRDRLRQIGIDRELQTIEGWLDLERAWPIAPRGFRKELGLIWPIISSHSEQSLDHVIGACARLRSIREEAGATLLRLWNSPSLDQNATESGLRGLVERLRETIHPYEIDGVSFGVVPEDMLGWWMPRALVSRLESSATTDASA